MARFSWYLHRAKERLSPLQWLILVLFLVNVGILMQLWPLSLETDSQTETFAPPQLPSQSVNAPTMPPSVTHMQQAPAVKEVTAAIDALAVLAEAHQLPVREVSYRDVVRPDSDLLAYQINFSVDADYQQLRSFIADTLAELPYLAMQQLAIQRDEVDSHQLRGDIQLTLYMRRDA